MKNSRLSKEEVIQLLDDFLNQNGLWYQFCDYLRNQGYEPNDIGLEDD